MEPKNERMCRPQWDGDPSGWRDYEQEVLFYKTGENLEVNWSVAARRIGVEMTNQELSPTARNIPAKAERKADRNRRGAEAEMARLETELGQQRPQKKGEILEMFFATNKLKKRPGERVTDYVTRFEEGVTGRHPFVTSATCLVCFVVRDCHSPLSCKKHVIWKAFCADASLAQGQPVSLHLMGTVSLCTVTKKGAH